MNAITNTAYLFNEQYEIFSNIMKYFFMKYYEIYEIL
jgi:hypothetical protein